MVEIEAKFKVEDVTELIEEIEKLGAEKISVSVQRDTYFIHSVKKNLEGKPTYLRVRTTDGKSFSAMHYKIEEYKWEEIETPVGDGDKVRQIYSNLGFSVDVEVVKNRQTWKIPEGEIVIDSVEGLGVFVEIEVDSKETLFKYCDKLGFKYGSEDPLEGKAYPDLVREAKKFLL